MTRGSRSDTVSPSELERMYTNTISSEGGLHHGWWNCDTSAAGQDQRPRIVFQPFKGSRSRYLRAVTETASE